MTTTNPKAPDIHAPTVERCAEIMVARSKLCGSKPGEIACLEGAAAIRSLVSDKPQPTPLDENIEITLTDCLYESARTHVMKISYHDASILARAVLRLHNEPGESGK